MTGARIVEDAVAADVCGDGDAALVSDVRWFRLGVPDSCAKVRARVALAGALTDAGCASVGCQIGCRLLSWRDTAVQRSCGSGVYARCGVVVVKCRILANWSHGVVQASETHSRFTLCARLVPRWAQWCARTCIRGTRLSVPAPGRMCRLLHCGSVLVATEFVTLRRCMSDGCADRAQIALQMRQCDLRIVRET